MYLVFLLHLLHLAELFWWQHALDPLHVPHKEAVRLQELVVSSLPCVLQLVVLLPLQLQLVTDWGHKQQRERRKTKLELQTKHEHTHTHTSSMESAAIQKSYTKHLKPFYWHFKSNLRPNLQWKCKLASVQNEHNGKRSLWTFINVKSKQRNTFKLQHSLLCKRFKAPALTRA